MEGRSVSTEVIHDPSIRSRFERAKALVSSPAGWLVVAAIALGVFLRFHAFDFPQSFLFDEHHFVNNARNYISGRADQNDHPPFGKLLIAQSMVILGDTPVGWRLPSAISGLLTIGLGAVAAGRLFSLEAGFVAGALLGLDGFLISYSRAGLLDGFLATGAMSSVVLATFPSTVPLAALGGVLTGIAMNIKFSGVAVFAPVLVNILLTPQSNARRIRTIAFAGLCATITYFLLFSYGLRVVAHPASVADVVAKSRALLHHHLELTDMKNPATSGWVTWALPVRPLVLGYVEHFGEVRALTSLGNVVVWWSTVSLTLALVGLIVWLGIGRILQPSDEKRSGGVRAFVQVHGRSICIVLSSALSFVAPWVATHRDSYIYHFLPTYAVLVLISAGFVAAQTARLTFAVLALVLLVGAFYAPVWSFMPLSPQAYHARLFLESWR